jgi:hypothetical protein
VFIHEVENFENESEELNISSTNHDDIRFSEHIIANREAHDDQLKSTLKLSSSLNKKAYLTTETSLESNRFNTIGSLEFNQNSKSLAIYSKHTLYSYMAEELAEYYRLTQMMGLDKSYVRSIRKKKHKEFLVTKASQ